MKEVWFKARRAVESGFWDTCEVTAFLEVQTEWGEVRWEPSQTKEMCCRLIDRAEATTQEGLIPYTAWEGILLYPAQEQIAAGSRVTVTKETGERRMFYTTGETSAYRTHKEAVLTRKCPYV